MEMELKKCKTHFHTQKNRVCVCVCMRVRAFVYILHKIYSHFIDKTKNAEYQNTRNIRFFFCSFAVLTTETFFSMQCTMISD